MSRRSMQHDLPLETEAAFFQNAPRGNIDGPHQPYNAFRPQIMPGEGQCLRHQFRCVAASPIIGVQVIGEI